MRAAASILILLMMVCVGAIAVDHSKKEKETHSDVADAARIAANMASEIAMYQYWTESSKRNAQERIAIADMKSNERIELARLEESAFQFRVNIMMKDGMSGADAMTNAREFVRREQKLAADEQKLRDEQAAFDSVKYWNGTFYFVLGCFITVFVSVLSCMR